jgi:hypothetical protein
MMVERLLDDFDILLRDLVEDAGGEGAREVVATGESGAQSERAARGACSAGHDAALPGKF